MGTWILRAVVVLLVMAAGFGGRLAYEETTTPAFAQDDDPRVGLDCDDYGSQAEAQAALRREPSDPNVLDEDEGPDDGIACETTDYDDPARDERPVQAAVGDGSPARRQYDGEPTVRRQPLPDGRTVDTGGRKVVGAFPTLDDGTCPTPLVGRSGGCYPPSKQTTHFSGRADAFD